MDLFANQRVNQFMGVAELGENDAKGNQGECTQPMDGIGKAEDLLADEIKIGAWESGRK